MKSFTRTLATLGGAAALTFLLAACGSNGGVGTSSTSGASQAQNPASKDFLDAYGKRYKDPLATYYAEMAFEKKFPGVSNTIGDDAINTYKPEVSVSAAVSPLGFDQLRLPLTDTIDKATSVEQFNDSINSMNTYMNELAKNPSPKAQEIITNEFIMYCGFHNGDAQKLADTLAAIVAKHGSAADYYINPAISAPDGTFPSASDTTKATIFAGQDTPIIDDEDASGAIIGFNNPIYLSIDVESYDNSGNVTSSTEVLKNVQFSVLRQPNYDPLQSGYVGIGLK